jgi:hypothetical protein
MTTIYLYVQKYKENMCALPCSAEGQEEPPFDMKNVAIIPCALNTEIQDLSVEQIHTLADKAYQKPGMSASCEQIICYDGVKYGKTRTVVHTRSLTGGPTT